MKQFSISEIVIVSHLEEAARRVQFHPQMTTVQGSNDTGKSALLKTIYWTLGAEPALVHPSWTAAAPLALLSFDIDGHSYKVLRRDSFLCLFSGDGHPMAASNGVSKGFGPALADMLDFGLKLPNRQGVAETPPPAFLFLPFYIDQDKGWTANWSSFANLGQYSKWKKPTVEYHIGLRDNRYYELSADLREIRNAMEALQAQLEVLRSLLREMQTSEGGIIALDFEAFETEIDELLKESTAVQNRELQLKRRLTNLHAEKGVLDAQISVLKRAMTELRKDYRFATHALHGDSVSCPTCGAGYDNSFAQRFELVEDQDRLAEYFADLSAEVEQRKKSIAAVRAAMAANTEQARRVRRLLQTRQGEVTLETMLQAHGRLELRRSLRERITAGLRLLHEKAQHEGVLRDELRKNTDAASDRREKVLTDYRNRMARFTDALNVRTLQGRINLGPDAPLRESGSDLPRALLAYYFAILHVMREASPSAFCPIIIDSPNQQAQDRDNLQALLTFIREYRPRDSQVILGLEDNYGIKFEGRLVTLEDERSLLRRDDYATLGEEVASWGALGLDWHRARNAEDEQGLLL